MTELFDDDYEIPPPFGVDCYGRLYRNTPTPRHAPLSTVQEESDRLDEEMRLLDEAVANMGSGSSAAKGRMMRVPIVTVRWKRVLVRQWIQRKLAVILYGIGTFSDYPDMRCCHGGHAWWDSRRHQCTALPRWLRWIA